MSKKVNQNCDKRPQKQAAVSSKKQRLDDLVLAKGLASSLKEAQALIMSGQIIVDNQKFTHVGQLIEGAQHLRCLRKNPRFVSRSGEKLAGALIDFNISVKDRVALDIGISTGGFTDCLLQNKAKHVFGVDVSYGLTDYRLQQDPRVTLLERQNARHLRLEDLYSAAERHHDLVPQPSEISLVVMDVSFISICKVLPTLSQFLSKKTEYICLVKPQFEAKREEVPSGGIINDQDLRRKIIDRIYTQLHSHQFTIHSETESKIQGSKGNQEAFLCLSKS